MRQSRFVLAPPRSTAAMPMTSPRSRSCCSLADSSSSCAWHGARLSKIGAVKRRHENSSVSPDIHKRLNLVHPYTFRRSAGKPINVGKSQPRPRLRKNMPKGTATCTQRHRVRIPWATTRYNIRKSTCAIFCQAFGLEHGEADY